MNNQEYIQLIGVSERNLKHVDVAIPKRQLTVVTGVSGSGKSTLLFDVLCKESERQHLLSIGRIAEHVQRPQFKQAMQLSPVVSVSQRRTNDHPRSTVGTFTEIYTHLRLLFLTAGLRRCDRCGTDVPISEANTAAACPDCSTALPPLTLAHLSFNTPLGACEVCRGLGEELVPDPEKLLDLDASITGGGMLAWKKGVGRFFEIALTQAARYYGLPFSSEDMHKPIGELPDKVRQLLLYGTDDERIRCLRPALDPPKTAEAGRFEGAVPAVRRRFFDNPDHATGESSDLRPLMKRRVCASCLGSRLNAAARGITIDGASIADISGLSLEALLVRLTTWEEVFTSNSSTAAVKVVMLELRERIDSLKDVGLSYLTLDRPMSSLSGGESQRVRLASSLHSHLTDLVFVYDEPSSGLHPKDTDKLFHSLLRQRDRGNTVIVVEHNFDIVQLADYVIEVGPASGALGGRIVVQGSLDDVMRSGDSITRRYLDPMAGRPGRSDRALCREGGRLQLTGASERNLKGINVEFPLGCLTAVAGVSGSGKTSLLFQSLLPALREGSGLQGSSAIERVVMVDQNDMGRSSRSNAATYTGVFDDIREAFAKEARKAGAPFKASHFSFNVKGGRCERCQGHGVIKMNMFFMPDALVPCERCKGKRYEEAVLRVTYRGYSIAEVLEASIQEASVIFAQEPKIQRRLEWLLRIGLGYLPLGQPASTLSGGEARRIQLAKELQSADGRHSLFVLDEPSTGLHPQDTQQLGDALDELVRRGHTVIIIEHKPMLIRRADWIIELGPVGGDQGGHLLSQGTVSQVRSNPASQIGSFL
ncbi:excinuclease ABC subunit UvrA [Paenibacillus xanthanilyticus]|uniref:UvrABC system protein A n=1 Tax=Paenibacillus xanthanilyticus TaxID=1783531 RepID=A0ABV8K6R4_9BACL